MEEGRNFRHNFFNSTVDQSFLQKPQGSGTGHCVGIMHPLSGFGPGCHSYRKGDKEEHTSHQGRIEDIVPPASKGHLSNAHCS